MRGGELLAACCAVSATAHAGPPYVTDDPVTVPYEGWEVYVATLDEVTPDDATGTGPHLEINYGLWPNIQLHLIAPLVYDHPANGGSSYGLGDLELGVKLRFVQEHGWRPMIGVFPLLELPTGNATEGLGAGHVQAFLPVWLQLGSGPWTTDAGGGLWINPGEGNRDFGLFGWLLQRQLSDLVTVGGELYYTTADHRGGTGNLRFDVGVVLDLTDHHHLMASAGRTIVLGDTTFQAYLAYQLTF